MEQVIVSICKYAGLVVGVLAGVAAVWATAEGRPFNRREWVLIIIGGFGGCISLTSMIVEDVQQRKARQAAAIIRQSSYEEIAGWMNRLTTFLHSMYRFSADQADPQNVDFSQPGPFEVVFVRLNLDSEAPVFPRMTWAQWIDTTAIRSREEANRILDRYAATLDPRAHRLIFEIQNSSVLPSSLGQIRAARSQMGIPIQPFLKGSAAPPTAEELTRLRRLHEWCVQERADLMRNAKNLRPINDLTLQLHPRELPGRSRLTDAELLKQAELASEYRSKRKQRE